MKTMRHPFGRLGMRCLVGLAAVVASAAAMAQNAIEHVSGSLQGGTEGRYRLGGTYAKKRLRHP